jgi:ribosomal protein S18 acetylase RimI-like enzyme
VTPQVTTSANIADREPALPLPEATAGLVPSICGATAYFKRFRMEAPLEAPCEPQLPAGFTCVPWSPVLLDAHAEILAASFQGEIDAIVFASLGSLEGCRSLMSNIALKNGFVPGATWLLVGVEGAVGSVQGLTERRGVGAIQNLGILPRYRGQGLGPLLLQQAMHGFREAGLKRVSLEVTAQNERAERLYRRLGFRRMRTLYKTVKTPDWEH